MRKNGLHFSLNSVIAESDSVWSIRMAPVLYRRSILRRVTFPMFYDFRPAVQPILRLVPLPAAFLDLIPQFERATGNQNSGRRIGAGDRRRGCPRHDSFLEAHPIEARFALDAI